LVERASFFRADPRSVLASVRLLTADARMLHQGSSVEEALAMARDAISVYLEGEDEPADGPVDVIVATVAVPEPALAAGER
jgi:hypothetical protein